MRLNISKASTAFSPADNPDTWQTQAYKGIKDHAFNSRLFRHSVLLFIWELLPRAPLLFILATAHFGEKKNRNHHSRHLVAEKRDSLNGLEYFMQKKELIYIVPLISHKTSFSCINPFLYPGPQNSPICTMRFGDYDESMAGLARNICSRPWK